MREDGDEAHIQIDTADQMESPGTKVGMEFPEWKNEGGCKNQGLRASRSERRRLRS